MKRATGSSLSAPGAEYVLEEAFRDLTSDYRHIVIDVGHSEMVQLNVMTIIDVLVVPTTPAKLDADHLINMLEEADLMRQDLRLPRFGALGGWPSASPGAALTRDRVGWPRPHPQPVRGGARSGHRPFSPRVIEASALHMTLREYRDRYGNRRDHTLTQAVAPTPHWRGTSSRSLQQLVGVA